MLYALTGFFRSGVDTSPAALQASVNEHLGQPNQHIRLAGAIHNRNGQGIGWLTLLEADSFDQAEAYLQHSPDLAALLYDRIQLPGAANHDRIAGASASSVAARKPRAPTASATLARSTWPSSTPGFG